MGSRRRNRPDPMAIVDYDSEHSVRAMHELLTAVHEHAMAVRDACARFRFDVVDPDRYFNRITQGGVMADLEAHVSGMMRMAGDWHVPVRCELDAMEWTEHPHFRKDGPWARAREQELARMKFYRDRGVQLDENGDPLPDDNRDENHDGGNGG